MTLRCRFGYRRGNDCPQTHQPLLNAGDLSHSVLRFLLLFALACQTAGVGLLVRYSRGVLHERYSIASTVICAEVLKLLVCVALVCHAQGVSSNAC